jgi:hypothetical protein
VQVKMAEADKKRRASELNLDALKSQTRVSSSTKCIGSRGACSIQSPAWLFLAVCLLLTLSKHRIVHGTEDGAAHVFVCVCVCVQWFFLFFIFLPHSYSQIFLVRSSIYFVFFYFLKA